jgi:hypothetical protein
MNLTKFLVALEQTSPIILGLINPALIPLAGVINRGIGEAVEMKNAKGSDKLAHVVNLVTTSAEGANVIKPGVVDPMLANAIMSHAISAVYDTAKLIHDAHETQPQVAAAGVGSASTDGAASAAHTSQQ